MTHAPTDLVGQTLGPYRLESLLGQGGFAWVFVGREGDGTPVAIKVLKPRYAGDPQFETRFRHESEVAARLDHPNIIKIRSIGKAGDKVYFVMDLCRESLAARLGREGPLPEADIVAIARDVTQGLGFAHSQGVIHRDLQEVQDRKRATIEIGVAPLGTKAHLAITGKLRRPSRRPLGLLVGLGVVLLVLIALVVKLMR